MLAASTLFLEVPSANAIFGLSTCEKLKSRMKSQDAIGYELWKTYQSTWKLHVKNPKDTNVDTQVVNDISNNLNLDLAIFAMAMKHANCFNAVQNSYLITWQTKEKLSLTHAQSWLAPSNISWDGFWTKDIYPKYADWLKILESLK